MSAISSEGSADLFENLPVASHGGNGQDGVGDVSEAGITELSDEFAGVFEDRARGHILAGLSMVSRPQSVQVIIHRRPVICRQFPVVK